ncbi:hypothetical protein AsAng_0054260 [Aureispira anguillae]|uniref:Uncharacterized protein n=1 Tax=Aureispira anguillae TaxID=2864201 RepID=A0A915YK06_9BACT|nr:hypothetical protein AsAng_0054260 [Aureispira anguillae]
MVISILLMNSTNLAFSLSNVKKDTTHSTLNGSFYCFSTKGSQI